MHTDLPLLRKITWTFLRSHPEFEFDELFSEACCAYVDALPHYDPSRGRKSTFLWTVVTRHLQQTALVAQRQAAAESLLEDDDPLFLTLASPEPSPEQALLATERWEEFLQALSPFAQAVVHAALTTSPAPLPVDTPRVCRGEIVARLREEGMAWKAIWQGIREVKAAVAALP